MLIFNCEYIKSPACAERFSLGADGIKPFSHEALLKKERALLCSELAEVLECNAAQIDFIIPSRAILKDSAKLAELYLFDSKILALISSLYELNELAFSGIDGVILLPYDSNFSAFFK